MSVDNTLQQRGARYGKFVHHAAICQGLIEILRDGDGWHRLECDMRQALSVICDKIARVLNGDPYYDDNYHDMQGYAKLVSDRVAPIHRTFIPKSNLANERLEQRLISLISSTNNWDSIDKELQDGLNTICVQMSYLSSSTGFNPQYWDNIINTANHMESIAKKLS